MEPEDEIATIERPLAVARAAHQPLEKERILYFLESFRDGDATSKEYQAKIIKTFVREVYLWDDKIGIDYYYMGGKNTFTYDLKKAGDVDIEAPGEFAYSPLSPTTKERTFVYRDKVRSFFSFGDENAIIGRNTGKKRP